MLCNFVCCMISFKILIFTSRCCKTSPIPNLNLEAEIRNILTRGGDSWGLGRKWGIKVKTIQIKYICIDKPSKVLYFQQKNLGVPASFLWSPFTYSISFGDDTFPLHLLCLSIFLIGLKSHTIGHERATKHSAALPVIFNLL